MSDELDREHAAIRKHEELVRTRKREPKLPEEVEEEKIFSMDMHYGDEPLYLSDPPQWPDTPWTP